jgi:AraC-like DNA-binding protein
MNKQQHTTFTFDYTVYLKEIAEKFGIPRQDNMITMPEAVGRGFSKAFNLNNGLSALVCDCLFTTECVMQREESTAAYFTLQFEEVKAPGEERYVSQVLFHETGKVSSIVRYADEHVRSLRVLVSNQWLNNVFRNDSWSQVLINRLSHLPANIYSQPMTAEVKVLVNKVMQQTTTDPLVQLYVENRILLLIEKFLFRLDKIMAETGAIPQLETDDLNRLKEVEEELKQKVNGPAPTISQLARIATMSPTKLKKIFKEVYGVPIYRYYQKVRMNHAKDLLSNGGVSIKEVGIQVGYSNLSHFATAFRKEFNLLPSELNEAFSKN